MLQEKFFSALLVLSLAACSHLERYQRPQLPVPDSYPQGISAPAPPDEALIPASSSWRDYFSDPRLQSLIELALQRNSDLKVAALKVDIAAANVEIRATAENPVIGASLSLSEQSPPHQFTQSLQVGATQWEVDLFGRLRNLTEAEKARFLASKETQSAVQLSLIASVVNAWLAVLADNDLLDITQKTLVSRSEAERLTRLRFSSGIISELDLKLSETLTESARAAEARQQRARAKDLNLLSWLVGEQIPPETFSNRATNGLASVQMPELHIGAPADLLSSRPDVRSAEQLLLAAYADVASAKAAATYPSVSFSSFGWGLIHDSLAAAGTAVLGFGWSFMPQIRFDFIDSADAELEINESNRSIAKIQFEQSIRTAFREVSDALVSRETLGTELQSARKQVQTGEKILQLTSLLYENGTVNSLHLLEAQRSLFEAQQSAAAANLALLQNQVLLYKTLGGGAR